MIYPFRKGQRRPRRKWRGFFLRGVQHERSMLLVSVPMRARVVSVLSDAIHPRAGCFLVLFELSEVQDASCALLQGQGKLVRRVSGTMGYGLFALR